LSEPGALFSRREQAALLMVGLALLALRRPDAVLVPQLWAEDGRVFYQEAYAFGWASIARTAGGYLQVLPRLISVLVLPLPLGWVAAIFTALALGARLLPAAVLLSSRGAALIPSPAHRVLVALLWIVIPNSWEIHATLTHVARSFAVASIVVFMSPATSLPWRTFDLVLIAAVGLSGPWTVLMLPILAVKRMMSRLSEHEAASGVVVIGTAAAQIAVGVVGVGARAHGYLGASVLGLARILGGQIVLASIVGPQAWQHIYASQWVDAACALAAAVGAAVVALAVRRGTVALRLFVAYSVTIVAAALVFPIHARYGIPAWSDLAVPGNDGRHWVFGSLALLLCLLTLTRDRVARWFAWPLLYLASFGALTGFRYPERENLHFAAHVRRFEAALPCEEVRMPINPQGWTVTLIKAPCSRVTAH
jgi:hypothetical protein